MLKKKVLDTDFSFPIVRQGVPSDAGGVIECMQSVMDEEIYLLGEYYLMTERAERERINSRTDLTLVSEARGEIVGVLTLQRGTYKKNRHTGTLGIAVKGGFRGAGLGKKMMQDALEWARNEGLVKINLEVFSSNINAIELYRKLGFEEEGRKKKQFVINGKYVDDVLMSLWIG